MSHPHFHFITGKLAEPSLRRVLAELAPKVGFAYSVEALPITVIALAPAAWIANHVAVPAGTNRVMLPGLCPGDLTPVQERAGVPVERGPADLLDLPEYFGAGSGPPSGYGAFDVAILAEINHVSQLTREEVLAQARR